MKHTLAVKPVADHTACMREQPPTPSHSSAPKGTSAANGLTYKDAGVDIDAGEALVKAIAPLAKATARRGADAALGGFGGLFDIKALGMTDPILVSGTDGVGTKLEIALAAGLHDFIGQDLVAMCVNDVLAQGAEPLFFLDYFACGKLDLDVATAVISGIASACKEAGCALIGGETAEMPGMYPDGKYDLAGFTVGAVERADVLPKLSAIRPGDVLVALPSSGPHSNGYSLIRKVVALTGLAWDAPCPFSPGQSLGAALLTPTRLYPRLALPAIKAGLVKGFAHITGGGLTDNIPRMLPDHLVPVLDWQAWTPPPVFQWLQEQGGIAADEMARTFNCGIGLVACVSPEQVPDLLQLWLEMGEEPVVIGEVRAA
ncbi:phosphoribosylformylglycinamidine cyclo-ligase [Candidatus Phycosocius bacilliformis]|uniref:Phosphoribosylformylglycinamidine cyclo-ligase n=2 Tax=Candidatus Phycosocius bacilliformis TaxID=1445552 RepID=A0A2P2E7S7_9PROT|nr:phosphoribosylformylglycinamidine cyclo-ligase [Candidatus Phycosocius bacilliformis]